MSPSHPTPPSSPPNAKPPFEHLSSRGYFPTELTPDDPVMPLPAHRLNRKQSMFSLFRIASMQTQTNLFPDSPINQREMSIVENGGLKGARSEIFGRREGDGNVGYGEGVFIPAYKQPRKPIPFRDLVAGGSKSYANLHPDEARGRNKLQKKRPEVKAPNERNNEKEPKEAKMKAVKSMFEIGKNKDGESKWAKAKDFLGFAGSLREDCNLEMLRGEDEKEDEDEEKGR